MVFAVCTKPVSDVQIACVPNTQFVWCNTSPPQRSFHVIVLFWYGGWTNATAHVHQPVIVSRTVQFSGSLSQFPFDSFIIFATAFEPTFVEWMCAWVSSHSLSPSLIVPLFVLLIVDVILSFILCGDLVRKIKRSEKKRRTTTTTTSKLYDEVVGLQTHHRQSTSVFDCLFHFFSCVFIRISFPHTTN